MTERIQVTVHRPIAQVWRAWTDPAALAGWFGDSDGPLDRPGARRIDFGDGDFFATEVLEVAAPHELTMRWRLLGIGDLDRITVRLAESSSSMTSVEVSDSGLAGPDAVALAEGWRDFLARLVRYCETGAPARYEWSEEIAFGFDVPGADWALLDALEHRVREQATAAGLAAAVERVAEAEDGIRLLVTHGGGPLHTEASVRIGPPERVTVEHAGWARISTEQRDRIAARRAWVEVWLSACQSPPTST